MRTHTTTLTPLLPTMTLFCAPWSFASKRKREREWRRELLLLSKGKEVEKERERKKGREGEMKKGWFRIEFPEMGLKKCSKRMTLKMKTFCSVQSYNLLFKMMKLEKITVGWSNGNHARFWVWVLLPPIFFIRAYHSKMLQRIKKGIWMGKIINIYPILS